MPELIHYALRDRVAVLTIDNPPVNAMGPGVLEGIEANVARANGDADVEAIVLIGAGSTFIAGADIKIFGTLKTRQQSLERSAGTHARLKNIEDSTKPLVAAIHGNALGGGLEVAALSGCRVCAAPSSPSRCAPPASRSTRAVPPMPASSITSLDRTCCTTRLPSRRPWR
jgi:3-hydroxyacyl-CoA dehydrogenase